MALVVLLIAALIAGLGAALAAALRYPRAGAAAGAAAPSAGSAARFGGRNRRGAHARAHPAAWRRLGAGHSHVRRSQRPGRDRPRRQRRELGRPARDRAHHGLAGSDHVPGQAEHDRRARRGPGGRGDGTYPQPLGGSVPAHRGRGQRDPHYDDQEPCRPCAARHSTQWRRRSDHRSRVGTRPGRRPSSRLQRSYSREAMGAEFRSHLQGLPRGWRWRSRPAVYCSTCIG